MRTAMTDDLDRRVCVAPMMDWTDRWCRAFHRMLTRRAVLFTEMVVDQALLHADPARFLAQAPGEPGPTVVQLGGSEPADMARAAAIAARFGYAEINMNVGCPSDRVRNGRFGACLMREPERVAACVAAMADAVDIPVTVKCRLGVDDQEIASSFPAFIDAVAAAGCTVFYVHARKAWLQGLSPKENREIPPLDYAVVRALKDERPDLTLVLNGGLASVGEALDEAEALDGAMLGRAAYRTPWTLARTDTLAYQAPDDPVDAPYDVVEAIAELADDMARQGVGAHALSRHCLGLFHGRPRAAHWRRHLSENAPGSVGGDVLRRAFDVMSSPSVTPAEPQRV